MCDQKYSGFFSFLPTSIISSINLSKDCLFKILFGGFLTYDLLPMAQKCLSDGRQCWPSLNLTKEVHCGNHLA